MVSKLQNEKKQAIEVLKMENLEAIANVLAERDAAVALIEHEMNKLMASKIGIEYRSSIEEALKIARAERDALYQMNQHQSFKSNVSKRVFNKLVDTGAQIDRKAATTESALAAAKQNFRIILERKDGERAALLTQLGEAQQALKAAQKERDNLKVFAEKEKYHAIEITIFKQRVMEIEEKHCP